jgi:multidrug efflux pump
MFTHTNKELAPAEDGGFLALFLQGPRYATADYTERAIKRLDTLIGDIPEVKTHFSLIGAFGAPNTGFSGFGFKPWSERGRTTLDIKTELQSKISKLPDAEVYAITPSSLPGVGNS